MERDVLQVDPFERARADDDFFRFAPRAFEGAGVDVPQADANARAQFASGPELPTERGRVFSVHGFPVHSGAG